MSMGFFGPAVVLLRIISNGALPQRVMRTITLSNLSPTFLSRSFPSSICRRNARASSLYRRISLSASSLPSIARLRAASFAFLSNCFPCMATELSAAILSCTEPVRSWRSGRSRPAAAGNSNSNVERGRCLFTRSGEAGKSGVPGGPGSLWVGSIQEGRRADYDGLKEDWVLV